MKRNHSKNNFCPPDSNIESQVSLFTPDIDGSLSQSLQSLGGLGKPASAVQRLGSIAANLAKAMDMIINFKDDAFAAATNVPKLTRLLDPNTSTPENHYNACVILHKLAEREASRNSLAYYPQMVESLVHLLQSTHDINTQTEAALALRKLCHAKSAAFAVLNVLTIADLVQLLGHPSDHISQTSVWVLSRLLLSAPTHSEPDAVSIRPAVRAAGGGVALATLLTPMRVVSPSWLAVVADCLRMLAYEDPETKLILLDCDIAEKIVYLLQSFQNHEKLQYSLARLIKVLSVSIECKQGLVEAGTVQAMTPMLKSNHPTLVLEALWGLRNLSDQAFHLTDTRELLTLLVPLVGSAVEHIAICSVGCLCNLTCQNAINKAALIEVDGVSALCGCLTTYLNRDEVTEPTCSALRNLTHQNEQATLAIRQIHDFGMLKPIVGLLRCDNFPAQLPLVKAVVGLIRNLGMSKSCRRDLHQLGATDRLVVLFHHINRVSGVTNGDANTEDSSYIEGVRVGEFVELLLAALQAMAQSSAARTAIIVGSGEIEPDSAVLSLVVQCLYNPSEHLNRAALGLLNEVSVCAEGASAIEQEGAIARITELVHSADAKTATYSASILHRVAAQLKPLEYQQRLSRELKRSLKDAGVLSSTNVTPAVPEEAISLPHPPNDPLPKPRSRTNLPAVEMTELTPHRNGSRVSMDEPRVYLEGREAPQMI